MNKTFTNSQTQELQTDDFGNPAMVAVDYGIELWDTTAGTTGKSCADFRTSVASQRR